MPVPSVSLQFSSGLTKLVSSYAGAAGSLLTVPYNMNTDARQKNFKARCNARAVPPGRSSFVHKI
jgi:hypothetical protein